MRLLIIFFCFFGPLEAEDLEFRIYFKGISTIKEVGEKVNNLVKRVNADNQFVAAKTVTINCADEENEQKEPLCKEISNAPILRIIELGGTDVHENVEDKADSNIYKEVFRIFQNFVKTLFTSRAANSQSEEKNWWENIPESFQEKITKYRLTISEEFVTQNVEKHSLLVCYNPDSFDDLEAVFSAISAAEEVKAPIGLLNCHDSNEFCCKEKKSQPSIVDIFRKEQYQTYDETFETEKIATFIRTLRGPVLTKLREEIVPQYKSGILPDFPSQQETVSMLFSPNKTNEPYVLFEKFAKENHGKYHLGSLVDEGVYRWPHHPALIIGKPFERVAQAIVNYDDLSAEGIRDCIAQGSLPSIHYLFDGKSATTAFSLGKPILFFYDKTRKTDATAFAKLASEFKIRSKLATFAVINGRNLFSVFVADMLKIGHREASFVLYIPEKNCAHFEPVEKQSEKTLESWLKSKLEKDCDEHSVTIDANLFSDNYLWERKKELEKQIYAPPKPSFHDEF